MTWTETIALEIRADEVDSASTNWALWVEGTVSFGDDSRWFGVVACSPEFIGTQSWVRRTGGDARWSLSDWPGMFFPWGFVVLGTKFTVAEVERAILKVSSECEVIAAGDWALFLSLMSRFVHFEDDPFRLHQGRQGP